VFAWSDHELADDMGEFFGRIRAIRSPDSRSCHVIGQMNADNLDCERIDGSARCRDRAYDVFAALPLLEGSFDGFDLPADSSNA
jgi:hypothetical protein